MTVEETEDKYMASIDSKDMLMMEESNVHEVDVLLGDDFLAKWEEEGRSEGFEAGKIRGFSEGYDHGTQEGEKLGSELGSYACHLIDKLSSLSGGSKDSTLVARICRLLVEIIAYPMTNAEDDLKETTFFRIKAAFSALEARNKTIKPNIPVEKSLDF